MKYKHKLTGDIVEARPTTATPFIPATDKKPAVKAVDEVIEETGVSVGPGHYVVTPDDDGPRFCPSDAAFAEDYEALESPPVPEKKSKKDSSETTV